MSKFTQGEWKVVKLFEIEEEHGIPIATVDKRLNREAKANARLIAAAPEMYELLESLVDILLVHFYSQDKAIRIVNLLARIDG